ncbi:metallophosphoesterase family protein [Desulfallas thermosapovorans]|uniref:DNA repair exonuclease SbcCD nuclease subunit n=1 Tax=Desulfallas thermosapovorans DSM 6562 TaxID=1121431 RepID=A0A5S4ZPJ3_9FIRM|nr:DNA repair exonuclease [Desulfallas thermosapovorans]TYO94467.1 DNA repair exonuclease SbcCD nuclease subunit [Desulfallas thermosapovorans DSM 6562]
MNAGFSFIHAADLHLDSPFRGYDQIDFADPDTRENVLRQLRDCTFTALDNIVRACLLYRVDFLVLAGDIYDLTDRSLRAQLRFQSAMERLAEAGIPVFVAHGNHDHDDGRRAALTWPGNVYFFPAGEVAAWPVIRSEREIARVYGISYPRRDVCENYAALFKREPDAPFAVAVLHCNVGGDTEHANYAPCHLQELVQAGFDYWALGHVHRRNLLYKQNPWIVYPGNTQGRHPRETGARGCYLVRVQDSGATALEFLPVDCVRWEHVQVPIDGLATEQELLDKIDERLALLRHQHGGRSVVARLELNGRGALHRSLKHAGVLEGILEEMRGRFAGPGGSFVWPESIRCSTKLLVDKEQLRDSETLLGDLLVISRQARESSGTGGTGNNVRELLRQALAPLHHRMARYIPLPGDEEFDALLEAAEDLALDLLWEHEEGND